VFCAILLIGGLVLARVVYERSRQLGPIVNRPVVESAEPVAAVRPSPTPAPVANAKTPPVAPGPASRPAMAPAPTPPLASSQPGEKNKLPLVYVADGTFGGGSVTKLSGIAIDVNRNLLVLGSDHDVVVVNLKSGDQVQRFDTGRDVLSIGVAGDGAIFVGEVGQAEKYRRLDKGNYVLDFALADGAMTVTAIHPVAGEIVCANAAGRQLVRFNASGKPLKKQIPATQLELGKPAGGTLLVPNDTLDFAANMRAPGVVVCHPGEHRVEGYTLDGKRQWFWGRFDERAAEGFSGCCNPVNVAVFPLDRLGRPALAGRGLGIVTAEKGPARVKVYDQSGKLLAVIDESNFNADNRHMYLAVDDQCRIYVADTEANTVRRFKVKS
jgi:hypothetical protein